MKRITEKITAIAIALLMILSPAAPVFAWDGLTDNMPGLYEYYTQWGGHIYHLVRDSVSWDDAAAACENNGGHLATVGSHDEWERIQWLIGEAQRDQNYSGNDGYWFGASDADEDGKWVWVDENEDDDCWDFTAWKNGEPVSDASKNCMLASADGWSAENGNEEYYYVLELDWAPISLKSYMWNGHTYEFVYAPAKVTYDEILNFCGCYRGHALTIQSADENTAVCGFISDFIDENFPVNYGITDSLGNYDYRFVLGISYVPGAGPNDGYGWEWCDGSALDYSNWANGGLNTANHYAVMGQSQNLQWYTVSDQDTSSDFFIVERDTVLLKQDNLNGHTYYCYKSGLDWDDANAFCQNNGGHLATITSEEEWDCICGIFCDYGAEYWLGANDCDVEGRWDWITGEDFECAFWGDGEPNSSGGDEDYLATNGCSWNDRDNNMVLNDVIDGFIMEVEHTNDLAWYGWNGHYYFFVEVCGGFDQRYSWDDINDYCEVRGGHPLTITSHQENKAVVEMVEDFLINCLNYTDESVEWYFMLGATDKDNEGEWVWYDGEPLGYANWAEGEPNNCTDESANGEDYVQIGGILNGTKEGMVNGEWNDVPYFEEHIFIIEFDENLRLVNTVGRTGEEVAVALRADCETQLQAITLRYINYDDSAVHFDSNNSCNIEILENTEHLIGINVRDDGDIAILFDECCTFEGDILRFYINIDENTQDGEYGFSAILKYSDENENIHSEFVNSMIKVKNYQTGDVNLDGRVTVSDAVYMLWALMGKTGYELPEYMDLDFDNNNRVNASDAVWLLWHIFYPYDFTIDYDDIYCS